MIDPAADEAAGEGLPGRTGNGFATAALAFAAAGVSVVTIVPGLLFAILGLRRARARGAGRVRCWLGIALSVFWAAVGLYLLPSLLRAFDPGCAAYKGAALPAYNKVIADFSGAHGPAPLPADLSRTIAALRVAAARSRDAATAQDLRRFATQLRGVSGDVQAGKVVPASMVGALNHDAARSDAACGTLRM